MACDPLMQGGEHWLERCFEYAVEKGAASTARIHRISLEEARERRREELSWISAPSGRGG